MPFCRLLPPFNNVFLLLLPIFLIGAWPAIASDNTPAAIKPSDVRMVIDISGSMKKNDPLNLRRPAVDMLVKLLPKDSKAGVWSFGKKVNVLVAHQNVDQKWSQKASTAASNINSIAQFTNIGAALERAAYDAHTVDDAYQKHVILLTDGMVDISRNPEANAGERQRIIDDVLPLYQQAGFTLHTIALSDNADKQLLDKLALETDGKTAIAKTADELMAVLLSVFDQAVPAEQAPCDGETFIVDSSIEEFTALIFRKQGSAEAKIMSPAGTAYSKDKTDQYVNWYHTEAYDLITVQQPLEGEWRVDAEVEPQSRITVVSDLKLLVAPMPRNIMVNDVVETSVAFQEEGNIVTRVEFLGLLDIDMSVISPGANYDTQRISKNLVPVDGLYPAKIERFSQEGEYAVEFMVDGKSFNRKFSHTISVRKPLKVDVDAIGKDGRSEFLVQVIPQVRSINVAQSRVEAVLTNPDGTQKPLLLDATADGKWQIAITLEQEGDHQLTLLPQVVDQAAQSINADLDPVVLSNNASSLVQEPQQQAQEEEKSVSEPFVPDNVPVVEDVVNDEGVEEGEPEQTQDVAQESAMMDYILYAVIAVVNLLIIAIIVVIYRKLFKKKPDEPTAATEEEDSQEDGFSEPPMDEMAVDDIEDETAPEAEVPSEAIPAASDAEENSQAADEDEDETDITMGMDDDDDVNLDEDDPEFSLDDFSPDSLDDDVSDFDDEKKE